MPSGREPQRHDRQSRASISRDDVAEPDPTRSCFGVPVIFPNQTVWILMILTTLEIIGYFITSAIIVHNYFTVDNQSTNVWREHLDCSAAVVINAFFAVFYLFHGVFRQRKEDLFCLLFSLLAITATVFYDYFFHADEFRSVNVARCVIGAVCVPFNIGFVVYVLHLPEWQEVRRKSGVLKVRRSRFFALQKIVIQCIVLLYAVYEIQSLLNVVDRIVLLVLSLLGFMGVAVGWIAVTRGRRALLVPFVGLGLAFPITMLAFIAIRSTSWSRTNINAFLFGLITFVVLVVAKILDSILIYQWWHDRDDERTALLSVNTINRVTLASPAPSASSFMEIDAPPQSSLTSSPNPLRGLPRNTPQPARTTPNPASYQSGRSWQPAESYTEQQASWLNTR